MAVDRNMVDVVEMFSKCELDLTIVNSTGFTVLHIAARNGYFEMCEILLELGIDP